MTTKRVWAMLEGNQFVYDVLPLSNSGISSGRTWTTIRNQRTRESKGTLEPLSHLFTEEEDGSQRGSPLP